MFNWLNRCLSQKAAARRFLHHFESAEGPPLHRGLSAAGMMAVEDVEVRKHRDRLAPAEQVLFTMAYACMATWFLLEGVRRVLSREEFKSARDAMLRYAAKQEWFRQDGFTKIWDEMQVCMPRAMQTGPSLPFCPTAEMDMAVNAAGYPVDHIIIRDIQLMLHVALRMRHLTVTARELAEEHRRPVPA
jgi:hypothetical protein